MAPSLMTGGYPAKAALRYQAQKFTAGFPAHGKEAGDGAAHRG